MLVVGGGGAAAAATTENEELELKKQREICIVFRFKKNGERDDDFLDCTMI